MRRLSVDSVKSRKLLKGLQERRHKLLRSRSFSPDVEKPMPQMNDVAFEVKMPEDRRPSLSSLPSLTSYDSAATASSLGSVGTVGTAGSASSTPSSPARNVHPLDQPLLFGGRVEPEDPHTIQVSSTEITGLFDFIWATLVNGFNWVWNMDLFIKIQKADGSNFRIHVPSVLMALAGLQLIRYLPSLDFFSPSSAAAAPVKHSGFRIFPLLTGIAFCVVVYKALQLGSAPNTPGNSNNYGNGNTSISTHLHSPSQVRSSIPSIPPPRRAGSPVTPGSPSSLHSFQSKRSPSPRRSAAKRQAYVANTAIGGREFELMRRQSRDQLLKAFNSDD